MMPMMSPRALACAAAVSACTATSPAPQQQPGPETVVADERPPRWQPRAEVAGCTLSTADMPADPRPWPAWQSCERENRSCQFVRREPPDADAWLYGGLTADGPTIAETWKHDARSHLIIRPLDGPTTLAVAIDGPRCEIADVRFSTDTASFMVTTKHVLDVVDVALFAGPLRDDPAWYVATPVTSVFKPYPDHVLRGRTVTLLDRSGLRRAEPGDASFPRVVTFDAVFPWIAVVGDAVVYDEFEQGSAARMLRPDGSSHVFLVAGAGQRIGGLVADGDRLYWLVGDVDGRNPISRDWGIRAMSLWAARLSADQAPVDPRLVAKLDIPGPSTFPALHANGGKVVFISPSTSGPMHRTDLTIVYTDNGAMERVSLPDDIKLGTIFALTNREVVATLEVEDRPHGLVRVGLIAK